MSNAAKLMQDSNLDASLIMFSMWTEAVKNFAEHGQGNVIFLDGSPENMEQTIRQMLAMSKMQLNNSSKDTLA